jgi:UDP-N-acetylglucosamine--N-acetylmuramyl-(pentapeptide) pyrophosphoryl-undecaprenol N-acetylglucosamine transferase
VRHLLVAAAGTGGHVMPALAVAQAMRERGWTVSWLGTRAGMERALVEARGLAFDAIDFGGLRGKGIRTLLLGGFHLLRALSQSRAVVRSRRPALVFSTGGYVAVPAGLAAASVSVPLAVLNADAAPLLSTRLLKSLCSAIFCGFDGAAAAYAGERGLVTGNPVRTEIAALPPPSSRYGARSGPLELLVIGGSLGAQILNQTLPAALARLPAQRRPRVLHQCGAAHVDATRAAYAAAEVDADVVPFIDDIAACYARADLVLCRAGAITVAELAAAGVAAVLVPFLASTTRHQQANAEFLAGHGAGIHLPQAELTPQRLSDLLGRLAREELAQIAERARALGRPAAGRLIADAIDHIAQAAQKLV